MIGSKGLRRRLEDSQNTARGFSLDRGNVGPFAVVDMPSGW